MDKIKYLLRCIAGLFQKKYCPYCEKTELVLIERKYIVTALLKCKNCGLLHRHPKDTLKFLNQFYQSDYHVNVAMMTDLPGPQQLKVLKENNFEELRDHLPFVDTLFPGRDNSFRMVDYGCSWGYNVYKLKKCGINAVGYELSVPRANFGKDNLEIEIYTEEKKIRNGNDMMFSSHVIEHLHSIQDFIKLSKTLLNKEGIFIAFCPNGSKEFQSRKPSLFRTTWGSLHPNYLDIDFASHVFKNNPYILLTSDWPYDSEKIKNWDGKSQYIDEYKEGYELLIIAKPNVELS
jgi:Methyltransferase domain